MANLTTVVTSAASSPLVKAAAFGFGRAPRDGPAARGGGGGGPARPAQGRAQGPQGGDADEAAVLARRRAWRSARWWPGRSRTVQAYSPAGVAGRRVTRLPVSSSVRDFVADVRDGMAEREEQIHAAFDAGRQPRRAIDATSTTN